MQIMPQRKETVGKRISCPFCLINLRKRMYNTDNTVARFSPRFSFHSIFLHSFTPSFLVCKEWSAFRMTQKEKYWCRGGLKAGRVKIWKHKTLAMKRILWATFETCRNNREKFRKYLALDDKRQQKWFFCYTSIIGSITRSFLCSKAFA